MMLEHLGEQEAGNRIVRAIEKVIQNNDSLTPDMGGKATTESLSIAIVNAL